MSTSVSTSEFTSVGAHTSGSTVDTQTPLAAPPAPSSARELELEQRVQQLEKTNANLQSQLSSLLAQKSNGAPKDYKAVPLASRPFAEPFVWPTFPVHPTLDDFNYAKRVDDWVHDLAEHFDAETQDMERQVGKCRMCEILNKALKTEGKQSRQDATRAPTA